MSDASAFVGSYGLDPTQYGITPAQAPAANTTPSGGSSADPNTDAYRVILQEGGTSQDAVQALASEMRNRVTTLGQPLGSVLYAKNQYGPGYGGLPNSIEYQGWKKVSAIPPSDPRIAKIAQWAGPILSGDQPPTGPWTQHWSPSAAGVGGEGRPNWAGPNGQNIGGNLFYANPLGAPSSPASPQDDTAAFIAAHGLPAGYVPVVQPSTQPPPDPANIKTMGGTPLSGPQGKVYVAGLNNKTFDPTAPPGSQKFPFFAGSADQVVPTGAYYVDTNGVLHSPTFPAGQTSVDRAGIGFGQGVEDVAASENNLTGGGLAVGDPMMAALAETQGGPTIPQMIAASKEGETQARNNFDWQYGHSTAAGVGRFAGQVVGAAPAMVAGGVAGNALLDGAVAVAPGIAPAAEFVAGRAGGNALIRAGSLAANGAVQGGGAAALTSSTSNAPLSDQVLHGAEAGAIIGPAAGGLAAVGGNVVNALTQSRISPAVTQLADKAINQYGIPLRASQILGVTDHAMDARDSNLISEAGTGFAANNAAQKVALTKAIGDTFGGDGSGAPVTALTPEVMQGARDRIGGVMGDIGARTNITDTDPLMTRLGQIAHDAQQVLPDNEVKPILKQIENIGSTVSDGQLSGDSYLALTRSGSPLDVARNGSNNSIRFYAGQIRDELDDALEGHASPEDLADLQNARWQYKNLMTIGDIANKADVEGTISPSLLNGAVNRSFKNRAFTGAGDLGELAQISSTFMKDPPNSGYVARLGEAVKRNLLTGAIGLGAGADAFHDPGQALAIAGGAGLSLAGKYANNLVLGARLGAGAGAKLVERAPMAPNPLLSSFPTPPAAGNPLTGFVNDNGAALGTLGYDQYKRQTAP